MEPEHVPVVVIGAGPTGASVAIMLGQRGIRCLVLERWPEVYPLPRAVHFDDEVFRIFADMGLADEVAEISRPILGMRLTDRKHRVLAELNRDATQHGHPQSNMFDQPALEQVLRAVLNKHPSVELRGGFEVAEIAEVAGGPGPVRVRYRVADPVAGAGAGPVREVWADYVLGADGANSGTRAAVGASMEDLGFQQQWLVVDVESPVPFAGYDGAQQVCDHDRAATFMPVVPGRYRWEFRLRPGERPECFDQARVLEMIRPWVSGLDTDKLTFLRHATYTFRGAVADRWRKGPVFLLGDAAHLTPPFIGQGMCAGIRDAANLAWKLALVLQGHADVRLLDTYQAERRPHARRVVQLAIIIGWLMTGGTARTAAFRRAALRLATRIPGSATRMQHTAWPAFGQGPLVHPRRRDPLVGRLCPQPRVGAALLDDLLGQGFAIAYRGPDRIAAYDSQSREFFGRLGTTVIRVEDLPHGAALAHLLDNARADAVLLRPDRIVAAAADTPDLRAWRRQLRAAGIHPAAHPAEMRHPDDRGPAVAALRHTRRPGHD
jgi:3-(3-hydroxy-phenyl)propionate hydroxylase